MGKRTGGRDSPAEVRDVRRSRGSGRERGCAAWAEQARAARGCAGCRLGRTCWRRRSPGPAPAAPRCGLERACCDRCSDGAVAPVLAQPLLFCWPAGACAASPADDGAGPGAGDPGAVRVGTRAPTRRCRATTPPTAPSPGSSTICATCPRRVRLQG